METPVETADTGLRAWIGRSETVLDHVGPTSVAALNATLDIDPYGPFRRATARP